MPGARVANTSPGSSSTGSRLIVASAAPVTMFVAPGPIELVHASVDSRFFMARVADRGVHHRLLVAGVVEGHRVGLLEQRLADAGDVAVPEDPEAARDQPLLDAVALAVLDAQEADQRLRHRQSHACLLADVIGSRGSISWSAQVPRIQAWSGSSTKFHSRYGPGHHVQVVQVVAGRRHRRPVVAARQVDPVAGRGPPGSTSIPS